MKAYIYIGGEVFPDGITERPGEDDLCIAADSGYKNAQLCGVKVSLLVGDMDSIAAIPEDKTLERIRVPAEKDVTDTQLAVEIARRRGADEIVLIGGFGGRVDHELSNLSLLEDLERDGIHAVMVNGRNRARFLDSTSTLIPRSGYPYLSLIAVDPVVKGVEIKGCRYPLDKARLTRRNQFAVSNEITGNCALIAIRRGAVYIIESRDAR